MDKVVSKTIKNSFDKKLTFSNILEAYQRSIEGKGNKRNVIKFNINLETNITEIITALKSNKYKPSKYFSFTIYEPKERKILALPLKDRIVQQWYIEEFIKPYIIPRLIDDTYACIKNRGTHNAVKKIEYYMHLMKSKHREYYILKCDIKKYFYSIDKNILYNIMKCYIRDKKILNLTKILIYERSEEKGIPIGNYTSQYFANIYLSKLDYYIKEQLKVKYYIRYMDDFCLLLKTKEECYIIKKKISTYLQKYLKLELNSKSRYYKNSIGLNFCGYKIYETHKLLRNNCKKKIKRKINKWNKDYLMNKQNYSKVFSSWNSFISHSKHANSYNFRVKMHKLILANDHLEVK